MKDKKTNAGYEIVNTMFVNNEFDTTIGVALGVNENAPSPYVTWECNESLDSFILGHYFSSREAALKDFFERGMKIASINLSKEKDLSDDEIKSRLMETAKKEWYAMEDTQGCCDIEIAPDYRESHEFLLQTAYDRRNSPDFRIYLIDEIYDTYAETIWACEADLLEKAGFEKGDSVYDRAEEILHNTIYFLPDNDHFLQGKIKLNLLIGTESERKSDFTDIHEVLSLYADRKALTEYLTAARTYDLDARVPDNGVMWLIAQQGYTLKDLRDVKEEFDAYFREPVNETLSSYEKRYEEFKKTHSPFLTSLCQELDSQPYSMGCLTVLAETTLDEYGKLLERSYENGSLMPKEIVLDKNTHLGIFDPWHGAGSCLEIELEKDVVLPNHLIFDTQIEGANLDTGYSVDRVYGLMGSCWKPCKEVRDSGIKQEKEPLRVQLQDASKEMQDIVKNKDRDPIGRDR